VSLSISLVSNYSTTKGSKKLTVPKTSASFTWNAPEVISVCAQGCLYIRAKIKPEVEDDLDDITIVEVIKAII
jgi:hypothetical protein